LRKRLRGEEKPLAAPFAAEVVTDQIAGWHWNDGLRPSPQAPVWPMASFRDRFLTSFGSTP